MGGFSVSIMPLTLSLAGLSVTFSKFINTNYPRVTVQPLSVMEFSAFGTPAISGSYFEPKYLWQLEALCDRTQRQMIEAIAYEFHTRRRALQDSDILLLDTTAYVTERLPRSRGIVPGGVETAINGTHLSYHGQFKTAISDGPKFSSNGRLDVLSISLTETVRVQP